MTLAFSMPPMRCSRPGVPGTAHGRARVVGVAQVRVEDRLALGVGGVGLGGELAPSGRAARRRRDRPRLGAVGEVAVGEQEHRRAVGRRDPHRLDARRRSSRPATAGAMIGTGDSPLRPNIACSRSDCSVLVGSPVDGPPRWTSTMTSGSSSETREPDRLGLQRDAGAGGRGHADGAAERGAERRADAGDLVLGLDGRHAEALEPRQGVQDVGGRGDRVGAEHQRHAGPVRGGDQAVARARCCR